jgi:hypothetical protein
MNTKKLLIIFILSIVVGFISFVNIYSQDDTKVALVKKIVKDVTYKKAGVSDWDVAKSGVPLKDGEQVKTGAKSLALILFTDGSGLLTVKENAILNIYGKKEGKSLNKNTDIAKGMIGFKVNKQSGNEEFKFTTPTAVASIRGTAGFLNVDDNNTLFFLESGSAEIETRIGTRRNGRVEAGNSARIDAQGDLTIYPSTEEEKRLNEQTRNLSTKKVIIKTNRGIVEIEYFTSGN